MHQATGTALSRCLQQEASAIAAASERLDPGQVEAALALLTSCAARRGKLVVSGVGKSGIVARKIAATFSSLSLTAVFLHPGDALHGDMGIVAADDVVLLLSNSGETEELLAILPHLRRRGTARIALVGRLNSSLAAHCDVVLDASVDREICPLNLAPTASAAWMHAAHDPNRLAGLITDGDLRRCLQIHGAGDWTQLTAAAMATLDPITVTPETMAATALDLMERNGKRTISVLPVVDPADPGRLLGLLRLHDLVQAGLGKP